MLTLAVLAGGGSSRMGQDKARMPFLGQPLIVRVLERLSGLADEEILVTDRPADYAFLGRRCVPDLRPGLGPLGGLQAALAAASHPFVALVACDMPFASLPLFQAQVDLLVKDGMDAVVPSSPAGLEPLHAVYRRETCLQAVEAALDGGAGRIVAWFPRVNVRLLTREETICYEPSGLAFWNLNQPGEFHQAEELARKDER